MDGRSYVNVDLTIQRDAGGYRVRVDSPAGQAITTFSAPFSDLELDNFLLRVGRRRGATRRVDSPEHKIAKDFGTRLFASLFEGDGHMLLRSSLDEARRHGDGVRIRLRLTEVPELSDVPWEYLHNPALNRFLGLDVETPLIRFLELPERVEPLVVTSPLRILVVISSPADFPQLDVEREWNTLHEAVADLERRGLVAIDRLSDATLGQLQRQLRRTDYHVLHFIGHGGFDGQAQDGVLVFEDDAGRGRAVSGQDLGVMIHGHRTMRMAVLNACEGGRPSRTDPFAGVAQSLVQQGLAAVVAMQFEITDDAAIVFAHEFYAAIADGYAVDAALVEARKAIFARDNGLEWGTPVLYLRTPDGRIFDVEGAPARDPESAVHEDAGREGADREPPASRVSGASKASPRARPLGWALAAGLVLVVLAALVAMPRLATKGTDHLIVPGKAMGAWQLGQHVAAYGFGAPSDRWKGLVEHGPNTGKHYYTGYAYSGTSARPELNLHECLKDGKVFAIYVVRKVHLPLGTQVESLKFRTRDAIGIGIGSSEQELFTAYGRAAPDSTSRWSERHGDTQVEVLNYSYAGLDVLLNAADRRIFGIGATTLDAWEACEKATFGR